MPSTIKLHRVLRAPPDRVYKAFLDADANAKWLPPNGFKKVSCGTELNVTQEGIPDAIPPEMCYLGWQDSLVLLGKLVEAEVK